MMVMTTAGLYIHVPFCHTKCGYCDFYSVPLGDRATAPLIRRTIQELRARTADCPPLRTIFIGGGTPTILEPNILRDLLAAVREASRSHAIEEFTVEANPATVDDDKARLLVEHGVTRVSMGAQSFIPAELAALERLHSPDDIPPSVAVLRRCGVSQINLDLIFGIPGQTMDTWRANLERAIALEPDHIACYGLTYEPNTRLTAQWRSGVVRPCDESLEADMFLVTIDALAAVGYEQYETSNFARPGCRCEHNLIYWRNHPYVGVGPSAAGCIDRHRYKNVADIAAYIRAIDDRGSAEADVETLTTEQLAIEMMMMQLRLIEGLSVGEYESRIGVSPLTAYAAPLAELFRDGLIDMNSEHIRLTLKGRLIADSVLTQIVTGSMSRTTSLKILSPAPGRPAISPPPP